MTATREPSPAQRARTVLARATTAWVDWLDGSAPPRDVYAVHLDAESGRDDGRPMCVEIADPAPLPARDRIRARVRVHGDGHLEAAGVVRIHPVAVTLVEAGATTTVGFAELRHAEVDPLSACESGYLSHLAGSHAGLVRTLAHTQDLTGVRRAVPWRLDRFGLVLRLEGDAGDRDVRLAFREPVTSAQELRNAVQALTEAVRRG